jgi:hypothetical protein
MRQLSLHASALNDAEYELYTTSLNDLAWTDGVDQTSTHDDAYYENMKLGVREARGWLRGRYSQISPANIDVVGRVPLSSERQRALTAYLDPSFFLPKSQSDGRAIRRSILCCPPVGGSRREWKGC